ncbi:apoptotic protease-activating factor 1 [Nematostella vectensis]|uniref:apoptotic protease-activating factor 1 n=1 Tax=Nematostella vectensis TaxID=45351 RepID=UPI0020771052|nr:apoptotic protease-activating factor 1 [Nematostella vectensis]XP_032223291.2 apoptotic protease-activating factor 1 [Nematostella vectensis]XP_048589816.1 apoptotic protease-activating factor 1 [Nematostella vectensis]
MSDFGDCHDEILSELSGREFKRVRFLFKDLVDFSGSKDWLIEFNDYVRSVVSRNVTSKEITCFVRWALGVIRQDFSGKEIAYDFDHEGHSNAKLCVSSFRHLQAKLDYKLREEDIHRMKFLLADLIPQGSAEPVTTAAELFEILEHHGYLSNTDLSLVRWLLEKTPRKDLIPLLEIYHSQKRGSKVPSAYGLRKLPVDYVDRQSDIEDVKKLLRSGDASVGVVDSRTKSRTSNEKSQQIVGIRGMGGIGKTVLTQAVCWQIKEQRQVIWLTVGQTPDLLSLLNTLATIVTGKTCSFTDVAMVQNFITESTADRDVLVVLDDVWDVNHAAAFDVLSGTCQLLVNTRNADVIHGLRSSKVYKLGSLSIKKSRELLMKSAHKNLEELSQQVRRLVEDILRECDGLPLALALVGSSLIDASPTSVSDWKDRLDGLKDADLEEIKSCFPSDSYPYENLLAAIEVSFRALPQDKQEKFLSFAIFPEDEEVPSYVLEMVWKLPGRQTRNSLSFLERRSLLLEGTRENSYMVHDVLLDYLRGRIRVERNDTSALRNANQEFLELYKSKCLNEKWSNGPKNDVYFFQHLAFHLMKAEKVKELEDLLLDFEWLRVKLDGADLSSLLADFRYLAAEQSGKEEVFLLRSSLMLSSNVISSSKDQLGPQLVGRLQGFSSNQRINDILKQVVECESGILPLRWCLTPPGGPLLRTIDGRSRTILGIAVTPDTKKIITGGADGSIRVWDYETGKELNKLLDHTKLVYTLALSPHADFLVSGAFDHTVKIWDMDTLSLVRTLKGHKNWVSGVLVTPDSKRIISSSYDKTVKIWDVETCAFVNSLDGHDGHVRGIAITSDGRRLVSASQDRTLRIWNLETFAHVSTLRGHSETVYCVCCSPDDKFAISGSEDTMVKIWDLESAKEVRSLVGHTSDIFAVAVTPDGSQVISSGDDTQVKVWSLESGEELASLHGHSESVRIVTVSPDGLTIVSGSEDATFKIWRIASMNTISPVLGHKRTINGMALSKNGDFCVTGSDNSLVKVWDGKIYSELMTFSGHTDCVQAIALCPDSSLAASGGNDCVINIWNLAPFFRKLSLKEHEYPVQALAFAEEGRCLVSAAQDDCIIAWDAQQGLPLVKVFAPVHDILGVEMNSGELTCYNRRRHIWKCKLDLSSRSPHRSNNSTSANDDATGDDDENGNDDGGDNDDGVDGDKRTTEIAAVSDHSVAPSRSFWNPDFPVQEGPDSGSHPALMIRNGTRLLLGSVMSKAALRLIDVETGMDIGLCIDTDARSIVTSLVVTKDEKEVFVGTDRGRVVKMDIDSDGIVQVYQHSAMQEVNAVALACEDRSLLTADTSGKILQWNVATAEHKLVLDFDQSKVNSGCAVAETSAAFCDSTGRLHVVCVSRGISVTIDAHEHAVHAVAYNAAVDYLITGSRHEHVIKGWRVCISESAITCKLVFSINSNHDSGVRTLTWSPDGLSLYSASTDNKIAHWDVTEPSYSQRQNEIKASSFGISYLYADNERLIATFDDAHVITWDIKSREVIRSANGHWGRYNVVSFFPQGDQVVSNGHHFTLKQWDLGSGRIKHIYPHSNEITTLCVLPCGRYLVTGSRDKILRLWEAGNPECVSRFYFEHIPQTVACSEAGGVCVGLTNGQVCFMELRV